MLSFFDPLLILLTAFIFGCGFYRHVSLWRIGTAENRTANLGARLRSTLFQIVGHGRILRERYPGLMHLLLFYGFIIPFSIIILFQFFFSLPSPLGHIFSLLLDGIGFLGLVGIIMAIIRRYIQKPARLESMPQDAIGLALIFSILVFGFLVEGLRIGSTYSSGSGWSPIGSLVAGIFNGFGFSRLQESLDLRTAPLFIYSCLFHPLCCNLPGIVKPVMQSKSCIYAIPCIQYCCPGPLEQRTASKDTSLQALYSAAKEPPAFYCWSWNNFFF